MNVSHHGEQPSGKPDGSGSSHHGPPFPAFWVLLAAFLSFVLSGPLLYILALGPAIVGALLATWAAVALKRRGAGRGRRVVLGPLWIVLAGMSPALLVWLSFLPRVNFE